MIKTILLIVLFIALAIILLEISLYTIAFLVIFALASVVGVIIYTALGIKKTWKSVFRK